MTNLRQLTFCFVAKYLNMSYNIEIVDYCDVTSTYLGYSQAWEGRTPQHIKHFSAKSISVLDMFLIEHGNIPLVAQEAIGWSRSPVYHTDRQHLCTTWWARVTA